MRILSLLISLFLLSLVSVSQDRSHFQWELSYEHRLPPIYFQNMGFYYSAGVIMNQDKQVAGNGLGGTITKRIHSNFGVFYRTHIRNDHMYYDVDLSRSVSPEVRTWLSDHLIGASYSRKFSASGNTLIIRMGYAWMNRGSNYALTERVDIPPDITFYTTNEQDFHFSANYLEVKWAWSKVGLGLNVYHVERSNFGNPSGFLQLGLGLSYGVY